MNILKNLLLLTIVSIVCLLFLESITRILKIHGDTDPTYIIESDFLPFQMKPNTRSVSVYGKEFIINNLGLRGPQIEIHKEPDVKRILLLGDSVTYGYCENYENIFSSILQERLDTDALGSWEVINGGHNGFNIKDSLNYFKNLGLQLDPDFVVLAVTASDNTNQSVEYIIKDGINYSKGSKWIYIPAFIKKVLRKSSLYMSIGVLKGRMQSHSSQSSTTGSVDTKKERMLDSVGKEILEISNISTENNIDLLVLSIPSELDIAKGSYHHDFFSDIKDLSTDHDFQFLDAIGFFDNEKQNYCLNDSAHLQYEGHKVISGLIFNYLATRI